MSRQESREDEHGFTLSEVLVTFILMGILFGIASSVLFGVAEGRRVDSATNQVVADLRLAHSQATNRLTDTSFVVPADTVPAGVDPLSTYQVGPPGAGRDQPLAKGVIVVRNGNFDFSNSGNGFEGVIIVIGNGTTTGLYDQEGNTPLDGYVSASGNMTIAGNVEPSTTIDFTNLNSFFDVQLWSWRELYE